MSDILNTINWDELLEANPRVTHLPDLIRSFHTTKSEQEFDELFEQFTEFVHGLRIITPATIPATRILIQLLKDSDNMYHQQNYVIRLYYILRSTLSYPQFLASRVRHRLRFLEPNTPTEYRKLLEVYDIVFENQQYFIDQLADENPYFVITNIALLSTLKDQDEAFIPALLGCISESNNIWVKSMGAWAFAKYNYRSYKTRWKNYDKLLLDWVKNGDSFTFRVCSALGYMLISTFISESEDEQFPDIVIDTLAEYLSIDVWKPPRFWGWNLHYFVFAHMPFDRFNEYRIFYRHERLTILLEIFKRSELTSVKAHRHYREILDKVFRKTNRNESEYYWETHVRLDPSDSPNELIYEYAERLKRGQYNPDKPLMDRQKQVLQAIVDCDPFWEIPTNLFSYFYGLPDDREELRRLANQG